MQWQLGRRLLVFIGCAAVAACAPDAMPADTSTRAEMSSVSNEQLDGAFDAAISCVRDADIQTDIAHDGIGGYTYNLRATGTDRLEELDLAIEECMSSIFGPVAARYNEVHGLSSDERRSVENATVQCAADAGVVVDEYPDLMPLLDQEHSNGDGALSRCFDMATDFVQSLVRERGE